MFSSLAVSRLLMSLFMGCIYTTVSSSTLRMSCTTLRVTGHHMLDQYNYSLDGGYGAFIADCDGCPFLRLDLVRLASIIHVLWLGAETLSDAFIATALLLSMWKRDIQLAEDSQKSLFELFLRYTLQSGLVATICAAGGFISYVSSVCESVPDNRHLQPRGLALNSRTATWFLGHSLDGKVSASTEEKVSLMKNQRRASEPPPAPSEFGIHGHKFPKLVRMPNLPEQSFKSPD
ncbi:hypothetical protein D9757_005721 [Collybiopsis confluens]|uniref:Uncharacterized protein n=1 Tax=Collybiopsis confluens TaxID=2823264 RepID=A0A8H5MAZ7_9AGAR|nr:hypothetical protein D9757_005721 [Collybiopsis confluens]